MTTGAVSRQMQALEKHFGEELFIRGHRELTLTKKGEEYLASVAEAFLELRSATERIFGLHAAGPLRVSSSLSFVLRWLTPRMLDLHRNDPDTRMQITTSTDTIDFRVGDLDAGIRHGPIANLSNATQLLFNPLLVPVCSPSLLQGGERWTHIRQFNAHPILHSLAGPKMWSTWLEGAGLSIADLGETTFLSSSTLTVEAAAAGAGVAIAHLQLVENDIASGRLVIPWNLAVRDHLPYYLMWNNLVETNPGLLKFRRWLAREAQATDRQMMQLLKDQDITEIRSTPR
ncbi:transcriptional regulator [Sphingomonas bisphenolicum]|uniref:Transcriptional regulator n=1 Tax=Sphingomonas bisphenolicum TaxID=296544 RepID=A0ABM7GA22_9SPHN|nr:transcriptional regulator [Sphingomonas bisphenolicum]